MKQLSFLLLFFSFTFISYGQLKNGWVNPLKSVEALTTMDDLEYPFELKKIQLDEMTEIAYVDEGKGDQVIIFIHGLGSYLPAWKNNIPVLKESFRCIAIDLPGYGKSSKLPHSGMMTYYAEVVIKLIDALALENVVLAGHSMGGQIAIVTSLYYPQKISGLILAAPAGFETFTEGQKQWFRNVMTANGVKNTQVQDIQSNIAYNFYNMPKDAWFMIEDRIAMRTADDFPAYCHAIVRSVHGMVDEPVYDYLDKIKHPTLVLFGEDDNLIPNRYLNPGFTKKIARQGAEKISGAKLIMLPNTGHFLQFENPEAFNKEAALFTKSLLSAN